MKKEEELESLGLLLALLGQENCLDVGENTTLGNGHTREELVQLFVVPDGELEMTGDDASLLVVTGSISCQLEFILVEELVENGPGMMIFALSLCAGCLRIR